MVTPSIVIDPLDPLALGPKAIKRFDIPGATSTPSVVKRVPFE